MNRYILEPEDDIRAQEGAVSVFCGRSMIFFETAALERVWICRNVPVKDGLCGALAFQGPDALLGTRHQVLVPENRPDFAAFLQALRREGIPDELQTEDFSPERCDHNGHHSE